MRHDDRHIRKVDRHVIQVHGIAVLEMDPTSTAHAGANSSLTGVKQGWQPGFRDHLVDDVGLAIIGIEFLERWMKFEAAHPELLDEATGLAGTHPSFGRVNTGE